jgi:hypothetical protein
MRHRDYLNTKAVQTGSSSIHQAYINRQEMLLLKRSNQLKRDIISNLSKTLPKIRKKCGKRLTKYLIKNPRQQISKN